MKRDWKQMPVNGMVIALLVLGNAVILRYAFTSNESIYGWLFLSLPLLGIFLTLKK